ncbi:Monodehydroascorbate reductase (NADH) [Bertholletia excelsa]
MTSEIGQVISCHKVEQWTEQLQKGNESKKLIVVDFYATWCGPCRFMAPLLAEMARNMPHVTFLKVDVDELKSVAEEWKVEAMPTFVLVKEGKIVARILGADKDGLQKAITTHASTPLTATA